MPRVTPIALRFSSAENERDLQEHAKEMNT
jgi:hypothetical protein